MSELSELSAYRAGAPTSTGNKDLRMTTFSMADGVGGVVVGVDTHADVHVAAALDQLGRHVGTLEIATTTRGYEQLLRWAKGSVQLRGSVSKALAYAAPDWHAAQPGRAAC